MVSYYLQSLAVDTVHMFALQCRNRTYVLRMEVAMSRRIRVRTIVVPRSVACPECDTHVDVPDGTASTALFTAHVAAGALLRL